MKRTPSVGIIGGGFVGSSIASGFNLYADVKVYDIDPSRKSAEYPEVIDQDVLFVCLNTPMDSDGTVDTSLIDAAFKQLAKALKVADSKYKPVIIKSTVPPEALLQWHIDYSDDFYLVFNPEFLTERTARLDFQQSNRHIFGVSTSVGHVITTGKELPSKADRVLMQVNDLFRARFPMVPFYWTGYTEASLCKYYTNTFFTVKLSLMNEFAQICESMGCKYEDVIGMVMMDQRIGRSHWQVPGWDGKRGFGGSCFPKDLNGLIKIAESLDINPMMMEAAWIKNLEVRPERDWEKLEGRAVSRKKKGK